MKKIFKAIRALFFLFAFLMLGPLVKFFIGEQAETNYTPRYHENIHSLGSGAVVEVYGASAARWQGCFSMHTWIALKKEGEERFTIYEVLRERPKQGLSAVSSWEGNPDRAWKGHKPHRLLVLEGPLASEAIQRIEQAIAIYPYNDVYRVWPGPNCNTFIAYIGRSAPQLGLVMPPNAVGKDYGIFFSKAPSCTGYQFSIFGLLGVTVAFQEGIEMDFFGLNFGFDLQRAALLFPGIGKIPFVTTQ